MHEILENLWQEIKEFFYFSSKWHKFGILITIYVIILLCLKLTSAIKNSSVSNSPIPTNTPTSTPDPSHQYSRTKDIVFAGKVINSMTNEWPNQRLVLLYLKGYEIGRTETERGELLESGLGINDGFFKIVSNNYYGLTMDILNRNPVSAIDFFYGQEGSFLSTHDYLYHWFGNIEEGNIIRVPVPDKNIEYILVSLKGEKDSLPLEILTPGSTEIRPDGRIIYIPPSNADAPSSQPDPDVVIGETVYGIKEELIEVNRISVPSNNCQGSSDIVQKYTKTQSYTHQYKEELGVEVKLPLPAWLKLVAALQTKYGFEQGQMNSETIENTITTKAGSNQVVTFVWKEKWESGVSKITIGNQNLEIPFRAKKELIYEVENQQLSCP